MKCYHVNSETRTIAVREFVGLKDMQELVGGYIEVAYVYPNGDTLYVDEEGLLKQPQFWFKLKQRRDQPFAGNAVLVGKEYPDDKYTDAQSHYPPNTSFAVFANYIRFPLAKSDQ